MLYIPAPAPANGFFSLQKLKGKKILLIAAKHNKRTNQFEISKSSKINPRLSHLNESIMGEQTPEGVAELAKSLMELAGIKTLRKDAVLGIEGLFSLPADHSIDEVAYFQDCANWIQSHFGCHILSVDIHRDESCPHCHVLLLPLVNGKMIGSKLMGYKKNLSNLQEIFYLNVSKRYGLEKPPKPLNNSERKQAALLVLNHLVQTHDAVTKSNLWPCIVEAIYKFPMSFAKTIGIEISLMCSKPMKTVVEIFTSKGKGKNKEATEYVPKNKENICSVDFESTANFSYSNHESNSIADDLKEVIRENEIPTKEFNLDTGEFISSTSPKCGPVLETKK